MDREKAIKKYETAKNNGEVDKDIIPLLDKINSLSEYYTTSSCSGRIAIMEIPDIGDKKGSSFLGKWHREIDYEEVKKAIKKYNKGYLYFFVQSSIYHVVAQNTDAAERLIQLAKNCGFKYSSIRVIKDQGILVEILGTEHIQIPMGLNGKIKICEEDILLFFTDIANTVLKRVKSKNRCLEEKISSLLLSSS